MSEIQPSTVIQGISYIMWVKEVDDPASPDAFYAVVHKGNSRFGYQDFDFVCKTANQKFFFCNKVNDGRPDSTWEDCLYEMRVKRAPKGNPILLIDRAYPFSELAAIAYKEKFFCSEEGLTHLSKRTKPTNPPVSNKRERESFEGSDIIDKVKAMSDDLDKVKASRTSKLPYNPLIPSGATKSFDHATLNDDEDEFDFDEDDENMKERVALAESAAESLKVRNDDLEAKLTELKVQLASSLDAQKSFMAVGDKATANLEILNDDTADKVAKKLEVKLNSIASLGTTMADILVKIESINNAVSCQSMNVAAGFDRIVNRVDNSNQALSEGIMETNDALYNYGLANDDASFISIPDSIKSLLSVLQGLEDRSKNARVPPQKVCDYSKQNLPPLMICKCGCGYELQLGQDLRGAGGHVGTGGPQADRGSESGQRGFSIDRTGGSHAGALVSDNHGLGHHQDVPKQQQVVQSIVTEKARNPPHYFAQSKMSWNFSHPPPGYQVETLPQVLHEQNAVVTPDNHGLAAGHGSMQEPQLTRKQRKAIKNKEYHAKKKLRLSAHEDEVVASGSGMSYQGTSGTSFTLVKVKQSAPPTTLANHPPVLPSQPPSPFVPPTVNPFAAPVRRFGRQSSSQVWSNARFDKQT